MTKSFDVIDYYSNDNCIRHLGWLRSMQDDGPKGESWAKIQQTGEKNGEKEI